MTDYNPSKNYTWESESVFAMNGQEFGIILNTFRQILLSEEAKKILLIQQASVLAERVLERAVVSGIAKEATPLTEEQPPKKPLKKV